MTFVFKHPSKYKKEKLENQKDKPIEQKDCPRSMLRD